METIKAGIIGVTGYAGAEIARILLRHPHAETVWYGSKSYAGQRFSDVFRDFYTKTDAVCREDDILAMAACCDVIFTATPQGYCASVLSDEVLSQTKIIDLSADFRLKDRAVYEQWYGIEHRAPGYLPEAVYGLCEIRRDDIRGARLVANPGCYTTCAILSCYPALAKGLIDPDTLIVDAMSGVSGAGRSAKTDNLFCEVNEGAKPYGVTSHRHTPEIEEQLSAAVGREVKITFTPHLVPMNRGILATSYASLSRDLTTQEAREIYNTYYEKEAFIRILPEGMYPRTQDVEHTNFLDIQVAVDKRTNRLIITAALDNLVKGAAGQAVQNMNLMFDLPESCGLYD